jgi:cell wall-associated NlpC family hydrolase
MAALRPVAWSAVVGTAFAVMVAAPAHADPTSVPDAGSRPAPAGQLRLPGAGPITPAVLGTPRPGPLGQQILAAETEVGSLGERLKSLDEQLGVAHEARMRTEQLWREASQRVIGLRAQAESAAAEAYKSATELGPFGSFGSDLRRLGLLAPGPTEDGAGPETAARDVARAEEEEAAKFHAYTEALITEQGLQGQRTALAATFQARQVALIKLKQDNVTQLARIEAEQDAFERSQAGRYGQAGINVDGEAPAPQALQAVRFALGQLRKPYEWGAEGPDRFDCSGLMWASYRSAGITLARVAKDQYHTTTPISVDKLLPGDLVFFATDRGDWRSIHHVGMYIGDGKMVHAPTTGDVVKISNVWWSRFFGATRVVGAVPAPAQPAPPVNTPPHAPPQTTPPAPPPVVLNPPTAPPALPTAPKAPTSAPPRRDPSSTPTTTAPSSTPPTTSASTTPALDQSSTASTSTAPTTAEATSPTAESSTTSTSEPAPSPSGSAQPTP